MCGPHRASPDPLSIIRWMQNVCLQWTLCALTMDVCAKGALWALIRPLEIAAVSSPNAPSRPPPRPASPALVEDITQDKLLVSAGPESLGSWGASDSSVITTAHSSGKPTSQRPKVILSDSITRLCEILVP